MKNTNAFNYILGVSMFMFGVLKFVDPFKTWYYTQISESNMSMNFYYLGIFSEILTGVVFLIVTLFKNNFPQKMIQYVTLLASTLVVCIMIVAIYVHLQPHVPAEVLPLKIKPPVIPIMFLCVAMSNIYIIRRTERSAE